MNFLKKLYRLKDVASGRIVGEGVGTALADSEKLRRTILRSTLYGGGSVGVPVAGGIVYAGHQLSGHLDKTSSDDRHTSIYPTGKGLGGARQAKVPGTLKTNADVMHYRLPQGQTPGRDKVAGIQNLLQKIRPLRSSPAALILSGLAGAEIFNRINDKVKARRSLKYILQNDEVLGNDKNRAETRRLHKYIGYDYNKNPVMASDIINAIKSRTGKKNDLVSRMLGHKISNEGTIIDTINNATIF